MPTALIVEDEPDANKLLSLLIQLRGYQTESAFTGSEALDRLGQCRPDVVFLDLMLPDLNGFEVCQTIKTNPETTLIPVVVVTARLAADNEVRGYGAGANDFVPKPYTPDQIFDALAAADAWRRDVLRKPERGEIPLDTRDPIEPLRELSRFRSLMRAWTPLGEEEVGQICRALKEIWAASTAWGKNHHAKLVATLNFWLEPDRIVLSIRDEAGWFEHNRLPQDEGIRRWVLGGPFDEITSIESERRIVLIRSHPQNGAPS